MFPDFTVREIAKTIPDLLRNPQKRPGRVEGNRDGGAIAQGPRVSSPIPAILFRACHEARHRRAYAVSCVFRSWPRDKTWGRRTGCRGRPPTPAPKAGALKEFHPPAGDARRRRVTAHPRPARARPNGSPSPFTHPAAYRTRPGRVLRIRKNHRNAVEPCLVLQDGVLRLSPGSRTWRGSFPRSRPEKSERARSFPPTPTLSDTTNDTISDTTNGAART
jgi:hypothetical protein